MDAENIIFSFLFIVNDLPKYCKGDKTNAITYPFNSKIVVKAIIIIKNASNRRFKTVKSN